MVRILLSIFTSISFWFIPGNSASILYSLSVSDISILGDQSIPLLDKKEVGME